MNVKWCSNASPFEQCCRWQDEVLESNSDILCPGEAVRASSNTREGLTSAFHLCCCSEVYFSQAGGSGPRNEEKSKVAADRQQKFSIIALSRFLAHVADSMFCEAQKAWTEQRVGPKLLMTYWKHFQLLEIYPNRNSYHFWKSQTNQYVLRTQSLPSSLLAKKTQ